jgi:hypothetical protein
MVATNSLNINNSGVVSFNSTTGVFTETAITQYNVLLGGAGNVISSIAPSATAGIPFISGGATANGSFGTAVVAGGGTGLATLTAYALLAGGTTSTGVLQQVGIGAAGEVLTSNGAGALPSFQAAGTPSSQAPYINVTSATQAMAVNQGYVSNNGTLCTFTPPATCAVGTIFAIAGAGAGGWSINLATNSQTLNFGSTAGTTALASTNRYDSVKFVCVTANTTFVMISSVGNPDLT